MDGLDSGHTHTNHNLYIQEVVFLKGDDDNFMFCNGLKILSLHWISNNCFLRESWSEV